MNLDTLNKVKARQEKLGISLNDLIVLSSLDREEVQKFFNNEKITNEVIKKITIILGLNTLGNEIINIETLKEKRAEKRALYIVSLVQDTMSLEKQGLNPEDINRLIQKTKEQFLTGEYQDKLWKT